MAKQFDMNKGANVKINAEDLQDVVCDECGHQIFTPAFLFKKVSAVLSPTGKASMVPLQVFKCASCGHINKDFIPNKDGKKVI